MKRRRDSNHQKITAFLSTSDNSPPPTKRVTDLGDSGTPSTSEDRNGTSSRGNGSRASADGAKHKTGYNSRWEADHAWVFYVEGEGTYCKLCRKFDTKNRQNQSKVWNMEPCTTHRKDVLARHEASSMHKEAVEQERACQVVKARGGIREAVQGQVTLQKSAVIGAMKCLYWLCKQEIASSHY